MSTFKFEGKTQAEKTEDWEKGDEHVDALFAIDALPEELREVQNQITHVEYGLSELDKQEEQKKEFETKLDGLEIKNHQQFHKEQQVLADRAFKKASPSKSKEKTASNTMTSAYDEANALIDATEAPFIEEDRTDTSYQIEGIQIEIERLTEELKKREPLQSKLYRLRKRAKKIEADIAATHEIVNTNEAAEKEKEKRIEAEISVAEPEVLDGEIIEPTRQGRNLVPFKKAKREKPKNPIHDGTVIELPDLTSNTPEKTAEGPVIDGEIVSENREGYARDKMIKGDIYDVRPVEKIDRNGELARSIRDEIRRADTFPKLWKAIERTRGYVSDTPEEIKKEYNKFFKAQKAGEPQESIHTLPEEFGIRFQALNPFLQREAEAYDFGTEPPEAEASDGPASENPSPEGPVNPQESAPEEIKDTKASGKRNRFREAQDDLAKAREKLSGSIKKLENLPQTIEDDKKLLHKLLNESDGEEKVPRSFPDFIGSRALGPQEKVANEQEPTPYGFAKIFALLNKIGKKSEKVSKKITRAARVKTTPHAEQEKKEPIFDIKPFEASEVEQRDAAVENARQNIENEQILRRLDDVVDAIHNDEKLQKAYEYVQNVLFPKAIHTNEVTGDKLKQILDEYPTSKKLKKELFKELHKKALDPESAVALNTLQQKIYGEGTKRWNFAEIEAEKVISMGAPVSKEEVIAPETAVPTVEETEKETKTETAAETTLSEFKRGEMLEEKMSSKDKAFKKALKEVFDSYALANPQRYARGIPAAIGSLLNRDPKPTLETYTEKMGINKIREIRESDINRKGALKAIGVILFGTAEQIKDQNEKAEY